MHFGKQKVEQVILKFCHVYFISSPKVINCLDPLTFCLLYPGLVPSHRDASADYDSFAHFQKEKVDFDQDFDQGEEGELENKWMGSLSWGLTTKVEKVRTSKEKKHRRMENMEIAKCMVR